MLIGIDGNEANIPSRVGVGQYAFNILLALYRRDLNNSYIIYLKNPPLKDLPPARPNWQYRVFGPQKLWTKIALPLRLYTQTQKLDLFFSPSHYSPHFSPFPTIPTIHDLGYLDSKDQFTQKDLYQLTQWTQHSLKKAVHVVAVSQFTASQLKKTYKLSPAQISVVPNGVGEPPQIKPFDIKAVLTKFKITSPFFLYVGTLKPNKNIPFLIKAFKQFLASNPKSSVQQLVIAGKKGWLFDEIFKTAVDQNMTDNIIFTDYITEVEKWSLIKQSVCLIIPSTYEGFGIPALEAMKVGVPVIASSIPAFKEVIGQDGLFIDPFRISDLSDTMADIMNPTLRQKLSTTGVGRAGLYTWDNSADLLIQVFQKQTKSKR